MDKLDIILAVMLAGFSSLCALMLVMWNGLNYRIDKLDEKLTDVDRRLCRLEGAFSSKDCCMIKDDRNLKAVE